MMQHLIFLAGVAVLTAWTPAAQEPTLDELLDRLGRYLAAYETQLSTVVAEERYEQRDRGDQRPTQAADGRIDPWPRRRQSRVLHSDIAFLRLPGQAEEDTAWFGVREVKTVDGRAVTTSDGGRLLELLKRAGGDRLTEAAAIVAASAQHNLGGLRTINMPTVPLELLRFANHVRFEFRMRGLDRVGGTPTRRLDFKEFDEPTIIRGPTGQAVFSEGSAWIEPATGRLWRVEVSVVQKTPDFRLRALYATQLRVEFMMDTAMGFLVPKQMDEEFYSRGGRGVGTAKYSNYRRFTTAARIVPQ